MTGRTHDLVAFTAINIALVSLSAPPKITIATALTAFSAVCIGGLAPDIDQSTATLWRRIPAGTLWGKILAPLLGGHRFISHSLAGVILFGFISRLVLGWMGTWMLVDMNVVWWVFMIGFTSHLVIDTITREGVPWLFPIPFKFGIPPIRFLRIKTGGLVEKYLLFPSLIVLNGILVYFHYSTYKLLLRLMLK